MRRLWPCVGLAVLLAGLTGPAGAGDRMKHSGTIVSIAADGESFVLAEVGTWGREARVTHLPIVMTPATQLAIIARADAAPSGFAGDFVELAIERSGLYLNDHVTVDCRHDGKRLIALKVTVTELPVAEIGIGSLR
jgi:hypothetical protein